MADEIKRPAELDSRKRKALARHCKRFWWIYLIVLIIIVLVVVLPVIFVAVPRGIQSRLDSVVIVVDGVSITSMRSDAFDLGINATLHSDSGPIDADVDGFEATLYLEDAEPRIAFTTLTFPALGRGSADENGLTAINVTGPVPLTEENAEGVAQFATSLMSKETFRVTIEGDTSVRISGISRRYGATFRNTVTLNGMNNFEGLEIMDPEISLEADDRGNNLRATLVIPNPSLFVWEVGNVTYATTIDDTDVGTTFLDDVVLVPGSVNVDLRATISQIPVLAALSTEPYCATGVVPFTLTGESVVNQGNDLDYLADALADAPTTVDVPLGESLGGLVDISCG